MRLRRSEPSGPGLERRRHGRGFTYWAPDGSRVQAEAVLARCAHLAIPSAWTDVWICPHPNGHIQVVGTDEAGRRQYIYHDSWHEWMAREKFARMLDLADVLPAARRGVTIDLRQEGYGRERILAGAFRMLDAALLRVGSETYARQHGSIGLTTLRGEHATVRGGQIVHLRFPGKSGKLWESDIEDADLANLIAGLKRGRSNAPLLAWRDAGGTRDEWHRVAPEQINADVRRRTGGDFTAKDFRTLHGTVAAARALASHGLATSARGRCQAMAAAARASAEVLGNTPAIARNSYIDPRVFDAFEVGLVVDLHRLAEGQLRPMFDSL